MMHKVNDLLVINVHTIHKCLYLIHTEIYKLLSTCDLLWPAMFKPKGMIFPSIHCAEAVITVPKSMICRWSPFIGQHEIIHGYIQQKKVEFGRMVDCLKESQQRLSTSAFQNRFQIELRPYAREMCWKQ